MAGTMKAVVFRGPNDMVMETLSIPQIGPNEVLVRSMASGICHSDFDLLSGKYIVPFTYPVTPGHEWSGEVVEVGSDVKSFKPGDRVVGECPYGCGECIACKSGASNYCPNANHFGFTENGAASEFFKVKARLLHACRTTCPGKMALSSSRSPSATTLSTYWAERTAAKRSSYSGAVPSVRARRPPLGAWERPSSRLSRSPSVASCWRQWERTTPSIPWNRISSRNLLDLTDGIGADLAIEASGHMAALQTILSTVRNDGRVVFTGINIGMIVPVELGLIQIKGLNIKGTVGAPNMWPRALQFLSRVKPNLKPVVTHRFPLSRAKDAYAIAADRARSVKVLLLAE